MLTGIFALGFYVMILLIFVVGYIVTDYQERVEHDERRKVSRRLARLAAQDVDETRVLDFDLIDAAWSTEGDVDDYIDYSGGRDRVVARSYH